MEYEVEREPGRWHIREKGQLSRGTTVTDAWLRDTGFGTLTRTNIDAVIQAAAAGLAGIALRPNPRPPDIAFKAGFKSYPSKDRGTKPRIPERLLFRA